MGKFLLATVGRNFFFFVLFWIFPRIFFPEILFFVMPYPFPYVHRLGILRIRIRDYFLIQMSSVAFAVHDFPVFILVRFTLFSLSVRFFALLLSDY